jgi:hypothetical protein
MDTDRSPQDTPDTDDYMFVVRLDGVILQKINLSQELRDQERQRYREWMADCCPQGILFSD